MLGVVVVRSWEEEKQRNAQHSTNKTSKYKGMESKYKANIYDLFNFRVCSYRRGKLLSLPIPESLSVTCSNAGRQNIFLLHWVKCFCFAHQRSEWRRLWSDVDWKGRKIKLSFYCELFVIIHNYGETLAFCDNRSVVVSVTSTNWFFDLN